MISFEINNGDQIFSGDAFLRGKYATLNIRFPRLKTRRKMAARYVNGFSQLFFV